MNIKLFIECLDEVCPHLPKESIQDIKDSLMQRSKRQRIAQVKFDKARTSKPIKKDIPKKKIKPTQKKEEFKTMFTQLDLEKEEKKSSGKLN